jgi:hypothetical protein
MEPRRDAAFRSELHVSCANRAELSAALRICFARVARGSHARDFDHIFVPNRKTLRVESRSSRSNFPLDE